MPKLKPNYPAKAELGIEISVMPEKKIREKKGDLEGKN